MHTRNTQGETQGDFGRNSQITINKIVAQLLQTLPIRDNVRVTRLGLAFPSGIGNRSFGNHTHAPLKSLGKITVNRLLIGDADRGLQRIESTSLDRIAGIGPVTAVTDVSGF